MLSYDGQLNGVIYGAFSDELEKIGASIPAKPGLLKRIFSSKSSIARQKALRREALESSMDAPMRAAKLKSSIQKGQRELDAAHSARMLARQKSEDAIRASAARGARLDSAARAAQEAKSARMPFGDMPMY